MRETWRPVPGWEGLYEVSDAGNVRSLGRTIAVLDPVGRLRERRYKPKTLKPTAGPNGYRLVSFTHPDRKRECHTVHRLVLRAFVGECPPFFEACHGNGIRSDNRLSNLRWDSRSANAHDRKAHGTDVYTCGEDSPNAKLTDDSVRWIRQNVGKMSYRRMARSLGVGHRTVVAAARRESWKHVA